MPGSTTSMWPKVRLLVISAVLVAGVMLSALCMKMQQPLSIVNFRRRSRARCASGRSYCEPAVPLHGSARTRSGHSLRLGLTSRAANFARLSLMRCDGSPSSLHWDGRRVLGAERAAYEATARRDGLKDFAFNVTGRSEPLRSAERAEYHPVYFIEPPGARTCRPWASTSTPTAARKACISS